MEQIFKKGDTVYWGQLKGEVTNENISYAYPIEVTFENGIIRIFTYDGRLYRVFPPVLSFTPYTLKGFSQERPCEFKDGDAVWVAGNNADFFVPRVFKEYKNGLYYCYTTNGTFGWNQCKPFKKEE